MLGHATLDMTRRHYVNSPEVLTEALQTLPQPNWEAEGDTCP